MAALHAAAGGEGWIDSKGWLNGAPLASWHGVEVDSLGRVATLDLAGNGLAGRLPAGLGDLAAMTALRVGDNALSGRLPRTLLDLPLDELDYAGTELCAPADEVFRAWLEAIAVLRGTGAECAPATDREILEMLHDATGGRDWIDSRNWLTDAPLAEWRGVEVDDQGRVVELHLWDNGLAGRLPPEFGELVALGIPALERQRAHGRDSAGTERPVLHSRTWRSMATASPASSRPNSAASRRSRSYASRTTTWQARCHRNSAASRACAGWRSRATAGWQARSPPN